LTIGETSGQVTDEGLAYIAKLAHLTTLFVHGSFSDTGLRQLATLKRLETLCIDSQFATSKGVGIVAELAKLDYLTLAVPLLEDSAVESLVRCSALQTMRLVTSSISDSALQQLRDVLSRCSVQDSERDRREADPDDDHKAWQREFDSSTPFETLLAKAKDSDLVEATSDKLVKHYRYWLHVGKYSLAERVIFLVFQAGSWIDGGGFDYLFTQEFEGDPDFSITADAFRIAGMDRSYEAFQAAIRLFPGGVVPRNAEERTRLYEAANKSAREGATRKFWYDDGQREKKLAEFIRANATELGHLDTTWRDLQ
jgi:hypothetical protein